MPPEIFLSNILEELLDFPEKVLIDKSVDEFWTLLYITVDKRDLPLLIWSWGKTIDSLRTLLRSYWFKRKIRLNLKIRED